MWRITDYSKFPIWVKHTIFTCVTELWKPTKLVQINQSDISNYNLARNRVTTMNSIRPFLFLKFNILKDWLIIFDSASIEESTLYITPMVKIKYPAQIFSLHAWIAYAFLSHTKDNNSLFISGLGVIYYFNSSNY